jgi:hypothetical protein
MKKKESETMKNRRIYSLLALCIMILAGGVLFGACSAASTAQTLGVGQPNEIEAAVTATLMQYMIETKVAVGASQIFGPPAAEPTHTPEPPAATATPLPSPTAVEPSPTQPPPPTLVPTSSLPAIRAEADTNCRRGPSTAYLVDAIFAKGSASVVYGRDAGWDWWYIEMPNDPGQRCWVWDGSTVVQGDASGLPVVELPALASTNIFDTSYNYGYYGYDPNFNGYYPYDGYYGGYYPFPCGVFVNGVKYPKCPPKPKQCCYTNWWTCTVCYYCQCKPVFQNPCRKAGCPPVTSVNFATYCDKYPKCCKD